VRNIVFTSAAGSMARVRFSNAFGQRPLDIARAALAEAQDGAAVAPRSNLPLTFAGHPSVVIPPGASVVSDRVRLRVRRLERLAVSVFLPHATGAPTDHRTAKQTNYVAASDHAVDNTAGAFTIQTPSWYFVTSVDVWSSGPDAGTLVAFGDSITDGAGSRVDANARWPNDLARRLDSMRGATVSTVDAGISGNQLLNRSRCCGASGLARFGRDVLSLPSVTAVIVLEGVNDIGARRNVSTEEIIAGYRRLIALGHAAGLKLFGGTLTPFKGARYWTRTGEAKREAVNAWIRHSRAFDGVIDFAATVADPTDPDILSPAYDSGDHLHPNDAGYQAMASSIKLTMLVPTH
jgi:lysophospholipase L1-like esterase